MDPMSYKYTIILIIDFMITTSRPLLWILTYQYHLMLIDIFEMFVMIIISYPLCLDIVVRLYSFSFFDYGDLIFMPSLISSFLFPDSFKAHQLCVISCSLLVITHNFQSTVIVLLVLNRLKEE